MTADATDASHAAQRERETGGRPRRARESAPVMFGKIAAMVVKKLSYSRPPKRLSSERTAHVYEPSPNTRPTEP